MNISEKIFEKKKIDTSALVTHWSSLYLTFVCFFPSPEAISRTTTISHYIEENFSMENSSGINEKTPSSTPSIDERDLVMSMRKLDLIKELGFVRITHLKILKLSNINREKQTQFQRLQNHLQQSSDVVTRENQVLREFRKELDMLVQERMSHIEELRLIHADINIVCLT
jgi:hypothetical protein